MATTGFRTLGGLPPVDYVRNLAGCVASFAPGRSIWARACVFQHCLLASSSTLSLIFAIVKGISSGNGLCGHQGGATTPSRGQRSHGG
eukprot:6711809-Pyramimonas_sp.AAC.1